MEEEEKPEQKGLAVNYKGILVPVTVTVAGTALYIIGNIISTILKPVEGGEPPVTVTIADLGRIISLWGLIIAFAGFLVIFLASGLIFAMKSIDTGEPSKQAPTDITEQYRQAKETDSTADMAVKIRQKKEIESLINEIDGETE
ncbi:MAG: hypothetical protein ACFFD4_15760 [Candidatus Odinarchaeota archaeon]